MLAPGVTNPGRLAHPHNPRQASGAQQPGLNNPSNITRATLFGAVIVAYLLFFVPNPNLIIGITIVLMIAAWWAVVAFWPIAPPKKPGVRTYRSQ